jgi:hypothetical protein
MRPLILLLFLAGCPTSEPEPPISDLRMADWLARGPHGGGVVDFDLVDGSRVTPAHGDQAELPERALPTIVWYPATQGGPNEAEPDAPAAGGSFPLIVQSWSPTPPSRPGSTGASARRGCRRGG